MFQVTKILKRGWWNNTLAIVAAASTFHEEKRLRFCKLHVARVEVWRIDVREGETFKVTLPRSVPARVGDRLDLASVMQRPGLRQRWRMTQRF